MAMVPVTDLPQRVCATFMQGETQCQPRSLSGDFYEREDSTSTVSLGRWQITLFKSV